MSDWRQELIPLAAKFVILREPTADDVIALCDLLSGGDATHFGLDEPISESGTRVFIERARADRQRGLSFSYTIRLRASDTLIGLTQIRQLDPLFESAEWEVTLAPAARGTGAFIEAAHLTASFAFRSVGVHRLESRVLLHNGRANGAFRKLGAVQEGVLRQSIRRGGRFVDQVLWSVLRDDWRAGDPAPLPRVH